MSNSKGEPRSITRARRQRVAEQLSAAFADDAKLAVLDQAMKDDGAAVTGNAGGGVDHRLQLLGRTATCTSSATGAKWNWIRATLREFGYGK